MGFRDAKRKSGGCQYTRYIDYCQNLNLNDQSIGSRKLGQAEIDCGFRTSETRWGRDKDEHVGVFYLDLRLSQTSDHIFKYAEVEMAFKPADVNGRANTTVIKHYSPKKLLGSERVKHVDKSLELNPTVTVPVGTFAIGKVARSTSKDQPHRWMFTGELSTVQGGPYYQRLIWRWQANELEPQAEVRQIHLAIAICHTSLPFSIEVGMSGKLSKMFSRSHFVKREVQQLALITPKLLLDDLKLDDAELEAEVAKRNHHLESGKMFEIFYRNSRLTIEGMKKDSAATTAAVPTAPPLPPIDPDSGILVVDTIFTLIYAIGLGLIKCLAAILRLARRYWPGP